MTASHNTARKKAYGVSLQERLGYYSIPEPNSGCLLWTGGVGSHGYGVTKHAGKRYLAHRAAWELARGPIPAGLLVCHKCDVPLCINPEHLWLGTDADNAADKVAKGRHRTGSLPGETNGKAKLTAHQVLVIRAASGPHMEMAARFGISRSAVGRIKAGKAWGHLGGALCQ